MKYIWLFIALVLLSFSAQAQLTGPTASNLAGSNSPPSPSDTIRYGGQGPLPEEKKRAIVVPKATTAVTIDGHLNEEAWKSAAVFKDFYNTGPGYNTQPSKPTEAYLMYDEHNLYIGFKCWDDRDKIRASVAKRDSLGGDDNVRVWLYTYDDRRRAYVLWFNPLGIQQDGIYTEGEGGDFSPDI